MPDLFDDDPAAPADDRAESIGPASVVLRGFARDRRAALTDAVDAIAAAAPWRQMQTPGGRTMSVEMTNAGPLGWISDRRGYRYSPVDPLDGRPWPPLPDVLRGLAAEAAAAAGFDGFVPDACLVNRYAPGTRLALHQDRDERDHRWPIVSVSLGLPAVFLFGGTVRAAPAARIALFDGDVVVWGGVDRMRFHGIAPLAAGTHPRHGGVRINLTLRRAG